MHIGLPTYSRSIAELGRDQADRGDDVFLALSRTPSLPQLRQHRRSAQSSAPRSEILRRVGKLRHVLDVLIDVARIHVEPLAVLLITEQSRPRRLQQRG